MILTEVIKDLIKAKSILMNLVKYENVSTMDKNANYKLK